MTPFVRPLALAAVAVAALVAVPSPAQEKPKPADPPKKKLSVMQRKLGHAQKVLEALAVEDFDKLGTNADGLIACVRDASWKISPNEKYQVYSNEFLRGAENLRKAAKEKKIDAAALAYVDLTLTCVRCHKYLRDEGLSLAPVPVPDVIVRR